MKINDFRKGQLVVTKQKSIYSLSFKEFCCRHPLHTGVVDRVDFEEEIVVVDRYAFKPWDLIPVRGKPKNKEV